MTIFSGQTYLEKHRFCKQSIKIEPKPGLKMIVVIPCYKENKLLDTLTSLDKCAHPGVGVEVIIVINGSEKDDPEVWDTNEKCKKNLERWIAQKVQSQYSYFCLYHPKLPKKHAGVGLARKIGMDEAVGRFELAKEESGIIVCLDADAQVAPNYLQKIKEHFQLYPKIDACSIYFEHPLEGSAFESDVYTGITYYELFLRYYVEALRFAGHPYAFHTIGSSMAVRSSGYQAQNGMNRRKAGEDFYFLMKFIVDGKLNELNDTCVYPSPRPADHVPFGTGRAIIKWMESDRKNYQAYHIQSFLDLQAFIQQVPSLYQQNSIQIPISISSFLAEHNFLDTLQEIRKHVTDEQAFVKRFFKWFNGLRVLKYVHFARDHYYPDGDLVEMAMLLWEKMHGKTYKLRSARHWLQAYREKQR